jgi:hypothetical protein
LDFLGAKVWRRCSMDKAEVPNSEL